jgi:hypothetical protein
MSLDERMIRYKKLYYQDKKDIRYLRDAILDLLEGHRSNPEYRENYSWIADEVNAEFERKCETQDNYEQIGTLVAYLVHNGASVKSALESVSEWLGVAETTVRDGYYKIVHTYDVDPKNATYYDLSMFFHQHEDTPLIFMQKQSDKEKPFPSSTSKSTKKYSKVQKAMDSACNLAQFHQLKREKREDDFFVEQSLIHQDCYQNW